MIRPPWQMYSFLSVVALSSTSCMRDDSALTVNLRSNLDPVVRSFSLPKQNASCNELRLRDFTRLSSRKATPLHSHSMSVPPVSPQPCTLCITDHYRGRALTHCQPDCSGELVNWGEENQIQPGIFLMNLTFYLADISPRWLPLCAPLLLCHLVKKKQSVAMSPLSLSPSAP